MAARGLAGGAGRRQHTIQGSSALFHGSDPSHSQRIPAKGAGSPCQDKNRDERQFLSAEMTAGLNLWRSPNTVPLRRKGAGRKSCGSSNQMRSLNAPRGQLGRARGKADGSSATWNRGSHAPPGPVGLAPACRPVSHLLSLWMWRAGRLWPLSSSVPARAQVHCLPSGWSPTARGFQAETRTSFPPGRFTEQLLGPRARPGGPTQPSPLHGRLTAANVLGKILIIWLFQSFGTSLTQKASQMNVSLRFSLCGVFLCVLKQGFAHFVPATNLLEGKPLAADQTSDRTLGA